MAKPVKTARKTAEQKSGASPKADSKRRAWRREQADQLVTGRLGQRIRAHRQREGLSINAASELTGIPGATLSRIENNKMTPTFPILLKLLAGLRLPWAELTSEGELETSAARDIDVHVPGQAQFTQGAGYAYSMLHPQSRYLKQMQPLIFEVLTTTLEGAGGLRAHDGIEFAYVLTGTLLLYFENEPPLELRKGASVLFNCNTPHAYVAKGKAKTTVLNVISTDPLAHTNFEGEPLRRRTP